MWGLSDISSDQEMQMAIRSHATIKKLSGEEIAGMLPR
jgi:hypothetical protein